MKIWVNEQIDPCGIVYSCIACCDKATAEECHKTWLKDLSEQQKEEGWSATLRIVDSWDEVPVNGLKLSV